MKIRTLATVAMLGLCAANTAWATDYKIGSIDVDDVWVRASAPGQSNGAGYLEIDNDGKAADRLLAVRSDAAERVELHTVQTENGVARMRMVDAIDVPANGSVKLAPGGYHVMFMKLKSPFAEGSEIPATLQFEKAGELAVKFKVKPANYNAGAAGHDHGGMKH